MIQPSILHLVVNWEVFTIYSGINGLSVMPQRKSMAQLNESITREEK